MSVRRSQLWNAKGLATGNQDEQFSTEKAKKKPGGLKKIWRIVVGGKPQPGASGSRSSSLMPPERNHDDDSPLTPPPPLSYLVDRGPGDLNSRQAASTPSLSSPTSVSNRNGLSTPGMSPPTAPSTNPSSPASYEGRDDADTATGAASIAVKSDENEKNAVLGSPYQVMMSDPAMRQRVVSSPSLLPHTASKLEEPAQDVPFPSSRPVSMVARDKSLPPLPGELRGERQQQNGQYAERPRTVYTYDPRQPPMDASVEPNLLDPQAGFRVLDGRRQSFGGITSRPDLMANMTPQATLPAGAGVYGGPGMSRYDDFGVPRGRPQQQVQQPQPRLQMPQQYQPQSLGPSQKRKSRFGIASLFGKRQSSYGIPPDLGIASGQPPPQLSYDLPALRNSGSVSFSPDEIMAGINGGGPGSDGSGGTYHKGPRMSVASRKALEELVAQDPEFVAYRYPSNDQRLDLLR
jgi:hypothetical protein